MDVNTAQPFHAVSVEPLTYVSPRTSSLERIPRPRTSPPFALTPPSTFYFQVPRRGSLIRLAQRRTPQLLLALSIPLLILLILNERSIHASRLAIQEVPEELDLGRLRSQYTLKKRYEMDESSWSLEREAQWKVEIGDVVPSWWGNVDEVGPSPYDHTPRTAQRRRILFLTDYKDYLERMNTHTYEIVDAALRHPNLITDVWGPGWAGYNKTWSLSDNVKRRQNRIAELHDHSPSASMRSDDCGGVQFDIVWTISDIFKQNDPHVDALGCGSLLVQQLGDCHELRCLKEWYPHANNITLSKYAFELPEVFAFESVRERFPSWQMGIFGHSPDTGNEWDFWPVKWSEKTTDATMFGYDGSFYPIRTTITSSGGRTSVQRHQHPGYTLSIPNEARTNPLETYTKGHPLYENHEALREDFAAGMRQAKICVFDASLERKMIRKYAQALLSGCVIAADLPTEHEEALERFVIQLKPSWSIERIQQEIDGYLAEPEKLQQMAFDGLVYARQHLTTTRKITDVMRMADAHRRGTRGFFSSHCVVEPTGAGANRIDRHGVQGKVPTEVWSAEGDDGRSA